MDRGTSQSGVQSTMHATRRKAQRYEGLAQPFPYIPIEHRTLNRELKNRTLKVNTNREARTENREHYCSPVLSFHGPDCHDLRRQH
jgi:hypothetical protein